MGVLSCLCGCCDGPLRLLFRGSLPRTDGAFKVEALQQPEVAEIVRDTYGVPHIKAATQHDLFFLNGVVHGQDRLWQLESTRRLASGRLCEAVGPKAVFLDRLMRQLGLRKLAEGDLAALRESDDPAAPMALEMLEVYTRGINWAVEHGSRSKKLPIEFKLTGLGWEPWTAVDSLALTRLFGVVMNFGFQHSLLRQGLAELFGSEKAAAWTVTSETEGSIPHIVDEHSKMLGLSGIWNMLDRMSGAFPAGQGSNWWVIHGSHTESGKPILVGDPHLSIKVPTFWYEVHLKMEGQNGIDAYGVAPPGVAGVLIGQNSFCATSITLAYCDVEDVFLERIRAEDGKYLYRNEWQDCEVRSETINIKGKPPQQCLCRSTCHGALLEDGTAMQFEPFKQAVVEKIEGDEIVLIAYAGIPVRPKSLAWISLLKVINARCFKDFDSALSYVSTTYSLNFSYADIEGHIGYVLTGEVPKRGGKRGVELLPMRGWTGENDWDGFVTHAQLPKSLDPPSGIIISANHKVINHDIYPHYLGQCWKSGYRAQSIQHELSKLLQVGQKVGPRQMPAVLMNVTSWAAIEFVKELKTVTPDVDTRQAIDMLLAWDGDLAKDSVAASLYEITHSEFVKLLLERGCKALGAFGAGSQSAWQGVDHMTLGNIIAGEGLDPGALLKHINELGGHLHLNVLRILRSETSPCDSVDRSWWLTQAGGRNAAVNCAVRAAVAGLRTLAGESWQNAPNAAWGRIHTADLRHPIAKALGLPAGSKPLDVPSVPCGGDANTVCQAAPKSLTDLSANASQVSLRVIFDLSDLSNEATNSIVAPLGQSGQFNSPHYCDQTAMWATGKMRPILTSPNAVQQATVARMRFA